MNPNELENRLKRRLTTMRHKAVILGALVAGFAAAAQINYRPDVIVHDTYMANDPGEIRLLGVCDLQSQETRCWNPSGTENTELETAVRGPKGAAPRSSDPIKPEANQPKDRVLAFRFPETTPRTHNTTRASAFWSDGAKYLTQIQGFPQTHLGFEDEFFFCEGIPAQKTTSVFVRIARDFVPPTTIPLKTGAKQGRLLIATIARNKQKGWEVLLKLGGDGPKSELTINVEPVDVLGNRLTSVAESPLPVTAPKGPIGNARNPFQPIGWLAPYEKSRKGRIWTSRIDPILIPFLRVSCTHTENVEFKDILLDPK